jgi:tRNA uridine 5-carboxymethylaminomethyl modification enzyme
MMTSRAEFRLLLREDNTADRVMPVGRRLGLVDDDRWRRYERTRDALAAAIARARDATFTGTPAVNDALARFRSAPIAGRRATLAELYKRPELDADAVEAIAAAAGLAPGPSDPELRERVETEIKYEGYLKRQELDAARMARADEVHLPDDLDYARVPGLSREVIEKLSATRPRSLGQASRISGVTPAAVSILMVHVTARRRRGLESDPGPA